MKKSRIAVSMFLLVACSCSRQSTSLTEDQATTLATRLANDKAKLLYQVQPFPVGRKAYPAHFEAGRWVWTGDLTIDGRVTWHGAVELAPDGSTNNVDVKYKAVWLPHPA
jgi:hypothetical protein